MKRSKILRNIIFLIILASVAILGVKVVNAWTVGETYNLDQAGLYNLVLNGEEVFCTKEAYYAHKNDKFICEYVVTMADDGGTYDIGDKHQGIGNQDYKYTVYEYFNKNDDKKTLQDFFWGKSSAPLLKVPYKYQISLGASSNSKYVTNNIIGPYKITVSGLDTAKNEKVSTTDLVTVKYGATTKSAKVLVKEGNDYVQKAELTKNETIDIYLEVESGTITAIELIYKPTGGWVYSLTYSTFVCKARGCSAGMANTAHQILVGINPSRIPSDKKIPLPLPKKDEPVEFNISKKDLKGNYISGIEFKVTQTKNPSGTNKTIPNITTTNKDILIDTLTTDGTYEYWITETAESATKIGTKTPRTLGAGENTDFAIKVTLTKTGDNIKIDEVMLPYNPDAGVDAPKVLPYDKTNKTLTIEWKNRIDEKEVEFNLAKKNLEGNYVSGIEFKVTQTKNPSGTNKTIPNITTTNKDILIDTLTADGIYEYWITEDGDSAERAGYKTPRTENGKNLKEYSIKIVLEKKGDQITIVPCNWSGCNGGNPCGKEIHVTFNPDEGANAPKVNKVAKTITLEWENRKDENGLKIYKYDKDNNKPVKGAVFDMQLIQSPSGFSIEQFKVNGTVTLANGVYAAKGIETDEAGGIIVLDNLLDGQYSFTIKETKVNNPEYLLNDPMAIDLWIKVEDGKIVDHKIELLLPVSDIMKEITFDRETGILKWPNKKSENKLKLNKVDENGNALKGAQFAVWYAGGKATSDPFSYPGKNKVQKTNLITAYIYENVGVINILGDIIGTEAATLADGIYRIGFVEGNAPNGYARDDTNVIIQITKSGTKFEITNVEIRGNADVKWNKGDAQVNWVNYPEGFSIYKYDKDTNKPVKGAVFEITGGLVGVGGVTTPTTKRIETKEDGKIIVLDKLVSGVYTFEIKEVEIKNSDYFGTKLPITMIFGFKVVDGKITEYKIQSVTGERSYRLKI